MSGYVFHPDASEDLNEVWDYIAADNVDAADRVIEEIFHALRTLVPLPQQGHRRPDLTGRPLRFKRVRSYLIAYNPKEKPLWVVAVFHGHRDPRVIAALLRGRE